MRPRGPQPDDQRGLRSRHPGELLSVVGARNGFDDGGLGGRHPGHGDEVLPRDGGHPHELGQAASELVAECLSVAADVLVPFSAGHAGAAGHQGVDGDLIAHGHAVGQWAVGIDDGAGELVSQHRGECDILLLAALVDANVGAAQQGCVHPEQHIAGLQRWHGNLLNPKVIRLMQHRLPQRAVRVWDRLCGSDRVRRGGHD